MKEAACNYRFLRSLLYSVLIAFVLFLSLPSPPVIAAPVLKLTPSSGPIGITVTITGTVFDSYEGDSIYIFFDATEIESSPIVIPSGGAFTISFVVPDGAAPGIHTIGAKRETTDSSFFISTTFTVEEPELTLDVEEGKTGTVVTLSGSNFYVNKQVTLYYYNDSNEKISTVTASSDGTFTKAFTIPESPAGSHRFTAYDYFNNSARVYFEVLPGITLSADSAPPGDLLTVRGTGFNDNSTVTISLGNSSVTATVSDDYGSFEVAFYVPEVTPQTYNLKARDSHGKSDEVEFTVTASASLSENFGSIGNALTVRGSGFQPGNTITVYYDDDPIAATTADNNGNFTVTFTVPPSDGGAHGITVSDSITTREYTYTVETIAPPAPALLLPEHNGITGANTYFQWQAVTDTSLPVTYDLEIASDRNFSNIIRQKTGIGEAQYILNEEETLIADSINSLFFWRVRATDGAGNRSNWAETRSFYVDIPEAPALLLPANETTVDFPIRFSWETISGLSQPITYTLQVSRNIEFSELLLDEKGLKSPDYVVTEENKRIFNQDLPYYWRVRATDNARNTSEWSTIGSFNIIKSGFPAWATITLISLVAVVLILLAYRYGRRKAYQAP